MCKITNKILTMCKKIKHMGASHPPFIKKKHLKTYNKILVLSETL